MPARVSRPGSVAVGVSPTARRRAGSLSSDLARPKSSTLTSSSAVSLMFAGLRSRWTMPRSCAASSAADDLAGEVQRLRGSARPRPGCAARQQPFVERFALDQLHHQRQDAVLPFEAMNRGDVRMVERGEDPRLALESGHTFRVRRERGGQRLQRDVAAQAQVVARDTPRPCRLRRAGPALRIDRSGCRAEASSSDGTAQAGVEAKAYPKARRPTGFTAPKGQLASAVGRENDHSTVRVARSMARRSRRRRPPLTATLVVLAGYLPRESARRLVDRHGCHPDQHRPRVD